PRRGQGRGPAADHRAAEGHLSDCPCRRRPPSATLRGAVVLCWVPLMQGGDDPALIAAWKAAAAGEPEGRRRANFAQLAITLAAAAGREDVWEKGLEGWEMETSSYLDKIRAAVDAKARAEGLVEGRAEGQAESILVLLRARFPGKVKPELEQRIQAMRDR